MRGSVCVKIAYLKGLSTKSLEVKNAEDRLFEGVATVEMVDKDRELIARDEIIKQFPVWIKRGAPIIDVHSNRVIGKGLGFEKTTVIDEGVTRPAVSITGKIFKDHELDNKIWSKIKSGEYKGLSFGGANKSPKTVITQKDGTLAYKLNDLEMYEMSVCKDPTVPLAIITEFSTVAKSLDKEFVDKMDAFEDKNGNTMLRCSNADCYVVSEKADRTGLYSRQGEEKPLVTKETVKIQMDGTEDDDTDPQKGKSEQSELIMLVTKHIQNQTEFNKQVATLLKMGDHGKKDDKEDDDAEKAKKAFEEGKKDVEKGTDKTETKKEMDDDEDDDYEKAKKAFGEKWAEKIKAEKGVQKSGSEGGDWTAGVRPDQTPPSTDVGKMNEILTKAREYGNEGVADTYAFVAKMEAERLDD